MLPSPQEYAFDEWFRKLGFRGRHDLSDLQPSLQGQLRALQTMHNDAFGRARRLTEHADDLPIYLDYIDTDEGVENAIATHDDRYAFVGITLPLVFRISDVCRDLSHSEALCATLRVRPSEQDYNELQATLFYSLLSFVVAHEWTHHVHGHLGQLSHQTAIFQEISD